MMHKNRRSRSLTDYGDSINGLAAMCDDMIEHSHTLCKAWSWRSLYICNDSTSEDSVLELAVFHLCDPRSGMRQCESLTVWNTTKRARLMEMLLSLNEVPGNEDFGLWEYKSPHQLWKWVRDDKYLAGRKAQGTCQYCA